MQHTTSEYHCLLGKTFLQKLHYSKVTDVKVVYLLASESYTGFKTRQVEYFASGVWRITLLMEYEYV